MAKQNWQVWQRRNDEEAVTIDFAVNQQTARQLMRTSVEAAKVADIELGLTLLAKDQITLWKPGLSIAWWVEQIPETDRSLTGWARIILGR